MELHNINPAERKIWYDKHVMRSKESEKPPNFENELC